MTKTKIKAEAKLTMESWPQKNMSQKRSGYTSGTICTSLDSLVLGQSLVFIHKVDRFTYSY